MKRAFANTSVCALLMMAGTAHGKDMSGRLGVGGDATLTGHSGVSATYYVGPSLGLQLIVGYRAAKSNAEDVSPVVTLESSTLIISPRVNYVLLSRARSNVAAVAAVDVFAFSFRFDESESSRTNVALEGGLRVEHFLTHSFSMHVEAGLLFGLYAAGASALEKRDGKSIELGVGSTFGQAGFTFWFE